MNTFGIVFEILENDTGPPVVWQKVTGNIVFDVKLYLTRKAQWVLYGHKTTDMICSTYAGVVSIYSAGIAFTYTALKGIYIRTK